MAAQILTINFVNRASRKNLWPKFERPRTHKWSIPMASLLQQGLTPAQLHVIDNRSSWETWEVTQKRTSPQARCGSLLGLLLCAFLLCTIMHIFFPQAKEIEVEKTRAWKICCKTKVCEAIHDVCYRKVRGNCEYKPFNIKYKQSEI